MKSLSGYEGEICFLNKKKKELEHEEFMSLLLECPALRAEKLREIKKIEERIKQVEEDKLAYVAELCAGVE